MKRRHVYVVLLFPVFAGFVDAQVDKDTDAVNLRIQVTFTGGGCDAATHVTLIGRDGPFAAGDANENCIVNFRGVPEGHYGLNVSAENLPDADTGSITMNSAGAAEFEVMLQHPRASDRSYALAAGDVIAVSELGAPPNARKSLQQANLLIEQQDFSKAIEKLNQAIAIYPEYAMAYNNLAVAYARSGEKERAREALQRAVRLDGHLGLAYLNLGRMSIVYEDFPAAVSSLERASTLFPGDPATLVLLAYADLMEGRYDDAIATSRKAHEIPEPHAFVHRLAADSFLRKGDARDAIVELNQFLREEPSGPGADSARSELAKVLTIVGQAGKPAS